MAEPSTAQPRRSRWSGRRRWALAAAVVAGILACAPLLLLVWFPAGYLAYATQSEIASYVIVLMVFSLVTLPLARLLWRRTGSYRALAVGLSLVCVLGAFVAVTVATGYSRGVQGALMVLVTLLIAPLAIALWSARPVPRRWFAAGLVAGRGRASRVPGLRFRRIHRPPTLDRDVRS
jgi:hypothetical protein